MPFLPFLGEETGGFPGRGGREGITSKRWKILGIRQWPARARRKDPLPGKRIKRERRGSSGAIFAPPAGRLPCRGRTPPFFARFRASLKKFFSRPKEGTPSRFPPMAAERLPLPERWREARPKGRSSLAPKRKETPSPGGGASGRGRSRRRGGAVPAKRRRAAHPLDGRLGAFPGKRGRFPEIFFTCRRSRRCPWRS